MKHKIIDVLKTMGTALQAANCGEMMSTRRKSQLLDKHSRNNNAPSRKTS